MAIHWRIPFKSLRQGRQYYINIYSSDSLPSGYPLTLKGGAEPFETEEDDDEDMFAPIRTQSGTIRIVNNKKATSVNATTPDDVDFDWHDLLPSTDTDRPVTLTDAGGNVYWQGFIQAQNYGADLYGDPQEIELPVQCPITALQSLYPDTDTVQMRNFAYLLKYCIDAFITASSSALDITQIIVQGSSDAQDWLQSRFDWMNLLEESDDEDVVAKYNLYTCLEDMCKFWGWTLRIQGTKLYLVRVDDTATVEQQLLTMSSTDLATMAGGSEAGTTGGTMTSFSIAAADAIFASDDNDDFLQRGPNKASVNVDINDPDSLIEFAPPSVEKQMEAAGAYEWHNDSEESTFVGYFTTQPITSFTSLRLDGYRLDDASYFVRRQLYQKDETEKGVDIDAIHIGTAYSEGVPLIGIQTKKMMSFYGGNLKLEADLYVGSQTFDWLFRADALYYRIGIGTTRASAKWFYMVLVDDGTGHYTISPRWGTTSESDRTFHFAAISGGRIVHSCASVAPEGYDGIPLPANEALTGYLFFEVIGISLVYDESFTPWELANLKIEYSRDNIYIENSGRPARKMNEERKTERSYKSSAPNHVSVDDEWNADCIYASDNNMEYGLGLLMDSNFKYIETLPYSGTPKHPEQQLADRVTAYWASNKRRVKTDVQAQASVVNDNTTYYIDNISPLYKITLDGTTMHPVSISRQWRDDVVTLTMMEV